VADPAAAMEDPQPEPRRPEPPFFRVGEACILCSICSAIAPEHFRTGASGDRCIVYEQPADDLALARCREAMDNCPVDAIGTAPASR